MSGSNLSQALDNALAASGLTERFDARGIMYEACPSCGASGALKLSLVHRRVHCQECGLNGPLLAYLNQRNDTYDDYHAVEMHDHACSQPVNGSACMDANELREVANAPAPPAVSGLGQANRKQAPEAEIITLNTAPSVKRNANQSGCSHDSRIMPSRHDEVNAHDDKGKDIAPETVVKDTASPAKPVVPVSGNHGRSKPGERIIITALALIFLGAGTVAAGLSGFANYQAFSAGVSDPLQGRIWGWSGVIAAVCSFGGFTFFWWHISSRRYVEGMRTLVFAVAGAAASIAGTSLYMENNAAMRAAEWQTLEQAQMIRRNQIADWKQQLDAIPPETRSVEGLEAYLAGVEAVGRTHHKPYRDAHNELGLAKRRAALEDKIATIRDTLLSQAEKAPYQAPHSMIPAWTFALMLEIFSSQGTSIGFIALLLLYGLRHGRTPITGIINRKPDPCV